MKKTVVALLVVCFIVMSGIAFAGGMVRGYYRSNGTYVQPHYRSAPDSYKWNNYGPSSGSRGLSNPYVRDNDRDGIPNYRDRDDNNNLLPDDRDARQYKLR